MGIKVFGSAVINLLQAIPRATTNVLGVVQLATNAETAMGVDSRRAVTPSGLSGMRFFVRADRNGVSRTVPANQWTMIGASNETDDAAKVYDVNTNYYTAPVTGLYFVSAILRLADGASADQLGFMVGPSGSDGSYTIWGDRASTGNRYTLMYTRVIPLTAGQSIAMWAYSPSVDRTISNASLTVFKL